jgi:hypothetical protein
MFAKSFKLAMSNTCAAIVASLIKFCTAVSKAHAFSVYNCKPREKVLGYRSMTDCRRKLQKTSDESLERRLAGATKPTENKRRIAGATNR